MASPKKKTRPARFGLSYRLPRLSGYHFMKPVGRSYAIRSSAAMAQGQTKRKLVRPFGHTQISFVAGENEARLVEVFLFGRRFHLSHYQ